MVFKKVCLILVSLVILIGCGDDAKEEYIWVGTGDPITVDLPFIDVPKAGGTYTITMSNYKGWRMNSIQTQSGDEKAVYVCMDELERNKYNVSGEWFSLECPQNDRILTCKVSSNETGVERKLIVTMTVGDVFTDVTLRQE